MVEERHKRALPARHSFLTDAVSSVLESQSKSQMPQIDCRTILKLDQDTSFCKLHDESTKTCASSTVVPQPVFRVLPHRRPVKNKKSVALSDEYYLSRHRKHEMEEKKQKNREKERLEHELYQQKQLVERLTTLDKSTLASIVSSLRPITNRKDTIGHSSMTSMELDRLHHILLQDARDQMYRYERLGLGRKRGQGFAVAMSTATASSTSPPHTTDRNSSPPTIVASSSPNDLAPSKSTPPPPPSFASSSSPPPPLQQQQQQLLLKKPTVIESSSVSAPTSRRTASTMKPTKESIVLKHFQSQNPQQHRPLGGGKRKSLRTAIAFGEKIPAMDDGEFMLPQDMFGDLMAKRKI